MIHFYSPLEKERLRKRKRASLCASCILASMALILCVTLCMSTCTANAAHHRAAAHILSILFGWAIILILKLVHIPAKAEYWHFKRIEGEQPIRQQGVIYSENTIIHIPKSVDVIGLRLETGEATLRLQALARCKKLLPPDGTPVRLLCAGKFVLAWEAEQ